MAICNKQHRYLQGFNELPEAQDNRNGGRHICAACAYEEGLKDALQGNSPQSALSHLPAIPSSKYVSIDASIISIYSLSVAPLVETRKKGHSQISLKMSYTYH